MVTFSIATRARCEVQDITPQVQTALARANVRDGLVIVFVPHTTAGVTINENADPDVARDVLAQLEQMVPWEQPFYRHGEGNSAAHIKASLMGSSVSIPVSQGRMGLGTWQGIWFCEFDGPRTRQVQVTCLAGRPA